jgi:AbrB family looped-hinge helix DNA binding protein
MGQVHRVYVDGLSHTRAWLAEDDGAWRGVFTLRFSLTRICSMIMILYMITTVTGKNQITIPAKVATAAGIQAGTRIDWKLSEDGVLIGEVLPSRQALARKVAGMGRAWLTPGADPVAQLIEERAQADRDEGLCQ